jgi:hypothetical protein
MEIFTFIYKDSFTKKSKNTMTKSIYIFFIFSLVINISGCATPANQKAMAIRVDEASSLSNKNLHKLFEVGTVSGGKETNPVWTSQVDNASFKLALLDSLKSLNYLSADEKAHYRIDATLQELKQPVIGLTFDVTSVVTYRVEGSGFTRNYPITATGTATVSDAFLGLERLRIANERSIQENIKSFVSVLSKENLNIKKINNTDNPASNINEKCTDLGFSPNTIEFNNCIKKLSN